MTESTPSGLGETAAIYKTQAFTTGMARLAALFVQHPELQGLHAEVDHAGHVDIIAIGEPGVLRDWSHALPAARRERGLYSVHYGQEWEDVLVAGELRIHVRKAGA